MKLLVTGTDGYIGVVLAEVLTCDWGHTVVGLDTGYYKSGWLFNGVGHSPATLCKDVRHVTREDLEGIDAVVHLAELSNDPLGQNDPSTTHQINHRGSVRLARMAKAAGVKRFVYFSSCSVYGLGDGAAMMTEESPVNPQTAYAECKVLVERDLAALADDRFSPVFLRNATAFGASPRMRFDVVLNNLAGLAWTTREIRLVSDGTPWRPLVHVRDICHAVGCALEAPRETVHNQIFNVGSTAQNYRVVEIAEIVRSAFPGCELHVGSSTGADTRSYRVSFGKIHERLPGFRCRWDAAEGALQLRRVFERIALSPEVFEAAPFTRLKQLQHLLETRQVDASLFWARCA